MASTEIEHSDVITRRITKNYFEYTKTTFTQNSLTKKYTEDTGKTGSVEVGTKDIIILEIKAGSARRLQSGVTVNFQVRASRRHENSGTFENA